MSDSKSKGKTNTKQKGKSKKKVLTPEEVKAKLMEAEKQVTELLNELRSEVERMKPINVPKSTQLVQEAIADLEDEMTDIKEELVRVNDVKLEPIKEVKEV
jgi:signal transduction histidine kinase